MGLVLAWTLGQCAAVHKHPVGLHDRCSRPRNGIELSHARWNTDVDRLLKELDKVMKA
jgi:hypothetical protein